MVIKPTEISKPEVRFYFFISHLVNYKRMQKESKICKEEKKMIVFALLCRHLINERGIGT